MAPTAGAVDESPPAAAVCGQRYGDDQEPQDENGSKLLQIHAVLPVPAADAGCPRRKVRRRC